MKWSKIFVRFNEIKFVHNFSNIKLYAHVTCVIYITLLYITFCFIYSLSFIFCKCEGKSKMYIVHESYNIWWVWFSITLWSHKNREPCSYCCNKTRKLLSSWYQQSNSWAWWYVWCPTNVFGSGDGIIIIKNPSTFSCAYSWLQSKHGGDVGILSCREIRVIYTGW